MVRVRESMRVNLRRALAPIGGLVLVYVLFVLTPLGRRLDALAVHGAYATSWTLRTADLRLLETISAASVVVALVALAVIGGVRGQWRLGARATTAVLGSLFSAELLKHLLPSMNHFSGRWRWLTSGSFPSGHAVIVVSISLALLSVSPDTWRRWLLGPLLASTAIATTATVTVGWHRPSDVVGSFFLATAWHRAVGLGRAVSSRSRERPAGASAQRLAAGSSLAWAAMWWAASCLLVLGSSLEGILSYGSLRHRAPLAYLGSMVVLLVGAGITLATMSPLAQPSDRTGLDPGSAETNDPAASAVR